MSIRDWEADLGKCCTRCLTPVDSSLFKETCPDHDSGKHLLIRWEPWVGVGSFTLYGIRSEFRAMKCFEEACGGSAETARKLTPDEFDLLRRGKARLEIKVVELA